MATKNKKNIMDKILNLQAGKEDKLKKEKAAIEAAKKRRIEALKREQKIRRELMQKEKKSNEEIARLFLKGLWEGIDLPKVMEKCGMFENRDRFLRFHEELKKAINLIVDTTVENYESQEQVREVIEEKQDEISMTNDGVDEVVENNLTIEENMAVNEDEVFENVSDNVNVNEIENKANIENVENHNEIEENIEVQNKKQDSSYNDMINELERNYQ